WHERSPGGESEAAGAPGRPFGRDRDRGLRTAWWRGRRLPAVVEVVRAAGGQPGNEMGRHDRAGRSADEVLALAQADSSRVLDPGQHAHHPGLAEDPAPAEHQGVGSPQHWMEASERLAYVIAY